MLNTIDLGLPAEGSVWTVLLAQQAIRKMVAAGDEDAVLAALGLPGYGAATDDVVTLIRRANARGITYRGVTTYFGTSEIGDLSFEDEPTDYCWLSPKETADALFRKLRNL